MPFSLAPDLGTAYAVPEPPALSQETPASDVSGGESAGTTTPQSPSPDPAEEPAPLHGDAPPVELATLLPIPDPPAETISTLATPPRTLWMGDIPPFATEEAVVGLWAQLGKNVLVKMIRAKRGLPAAVLGPGANAGYCFVEFQLYEDAQYALLLNGLPTPPAPDGSKRVFRLNWASGATLALPILQTPEFLLFVGDLQPTTTEAHLLLLFQKLYPSVKTVRVMTDPVLGLLRCFGFVRFANEYERLRAVTEMQGVWLAGRPLRVALATPRNMAPNGPGFARGPPPVFADQLPPFFEPSLQPYGIYPPMPPYFPLPDERAFTDPANTTVFVGGLAQGVQEHTLVQLFQPFGMILHVKIPAGKGCGFVRFAQREDAERAIAAMQGFTIQGLRIRLSWGRAQQRFVPDEGYGFGYPPFPMDGLVNGLGGLSLEYDSRPE